MSREIPDLTQLGLQREKPENGANTFTLKASSYQILRQKKGMEGSE